MWRRRVRTYRERGSVRFTTAERRSYALMVDIRIVSLIQAPFTNLKSNPAVSFYGKATVFNGAVPSSVVDMPFPRYRFLSLRNEQAATTYNQLALAADSNRQITDLGEVVEFVWARGQGLVLAPLLEHRETAIKFVGLPLSQFEVTVHRLEFEDGVGFELPPTDPEPTRNEDQYYEPRLADRSNPYLGNPEPSDIPNNVDPRDFAPQDDPIETVIGDLLYEFDRINVGFVEDIDENVGFPGQLIFNQRPDRISSVGWLDQDGNITNMTGSNEPTFVARVRNVRFRDADGNIFPVEEGPVPG